MTQLIRKPANPARADVLRGERSPFDGEVTEPVCRYCGGTGTVVGGDEVHLCWCQKEDDHDPR